MQRILIKYLHLEGSVTDVLKVAIDPSRNFTWGSLISSLILYFQASEYQLSSTTDCCTESASIPGKVLREKRSLTSHAGVPRGTMRAGPRRAQSVPDALFSTPSARPRVAATGGKDRLASAPARWFGFFFDYLCVFHVAQLPIPTPTGSILH